MNNNKKSKIIFVIGVSGSGKTSVGRLLAKELNIDFIDADDHHPQTNIEKMKSGIPLTDEDRLPWLDRLHQIAKNHLDTGCVIACSALKQTYRNQLSETIIDDVFWIYLKGSYDLIYNRMKNRANHFMDARMLKSQFETFEEPINAIEIAITKAPETIVKEIINKVK